MSLLARQDKAAGELVHAIDLLTGFRLNEKSKATLMRIAAGHERRTVALITQAHANLLECAYPPKFDTPLLGGALPLMPPKAGSSGTEPPPPAPMLVPSGTVLPFVPPPGKWERLCRWFCDRTGYVRKV